MKLLRETIRKLILENEEKAWEDTMEVHDFWHALVPFVDDAEADYGAGFVAHRHSDGCSTEAYLTINQEDDTGGIWIDKIEVVNSSRDIDPQCFRKGYAKQMLQVLADAADESGTPLALIAAREPYYQRLYPGIELPDKDELADLYTQYGFEETERNYAQVHMTRRPR